MRDSCFRPSLLPLAALLGTLCLPACEPSPGTEILWDTYGIPHIFADDTEDLFEAQGWAQMQAHGDLILRLYGEARGRAAEYWGEDFLESDVRVRTLGIPARAQEWAEAQEPDMARYLGAFVAGMNRYAESNPDALDDAMERALPVETRDVMGHLLRSIHFTFVWSPDAVPRRLREGWVEESLGEGLPGSNGWAVGPSRSATGNALLLANPHLPWSGLFTWFENHLAGPEIQAYGVTLVGMPLVTIGFTNRLGWTHTVNTHDGADLYELTLDGTGYRFDGEVREFQVASDTLLVRGSDGNLERLPLTIRRSVHGPVMGMGDGKAYAVRVVGLDRPRIFGQYYDMLRARNLQEFEAAMARLQLPMFTTMYADRDGHVLHLFNGLVPRREVGDVAYWGGMVPGSTSETLWTEYHDYEDLPRAADPESGWLQNANDPPWTTTFPRAAGMDPDGYPGYMAPRFMHLRAQVSTEMLMGDESITFDELVEYKHNTGVELADRLLGELLTSAWDAGDERARAAARVLEGWDGATDADSRGAILFLAWAEAYSARMGGNPFASSWDPADPLGTPAGLSDPVLAVRVLSQVADSVEARYGALDVAYGEVNRVRRDDLDLPGNGGGDPAGVFRAAWYAPAGDGSYQLYGGDTFILAVEFDDPIRARALLGYGNASQAGSPHRTDQLSLFSEKRLRPVWTAREEIEANLTSRVSWD